MAIAMDYRSLSARMRRTILAASIVPAAVQRSAIAAFRAQKMALLLMMENRNSLIVDAPKLS
jgi:hypothetical protein